MKKSDDGEYRVFSEALQKLLKISHAELKSELEKNKRPKKKPAAR